MKRVIEVSAKTVEAAINDGLSQLGITMDEADIKVLNAGGMFKKAKVEISVGEDDPAPVLKQEVKSEEKAKTEAKTEVKTEAKKPEPKKETPKKETPKKDVVKNEPKNAEPKEKDSTPKTEENKPKRFEPKVMPASVEPAKKTFLKKDAEVTKTDSPVASNKNRQGDNKNRDRGSDRRDKKPFVEKAVISAPVTEEKKALATEFLTSLLANMKIEGTVQITEDNGMRIVIDTEDSAIIGYRGEVLDAIQYLTSLKVNEKLGKEHILLSIDALGYRDKRVETLKRLAQKTAEKCIKNNRRVSLEPMNSADRRTIHAALSDNDKVITRSEGHEPLRRIVVLPKR